MPMVNEFIVEVDNLVEAKKLLDTLAEYDKFQLENRIKPDYSNLGGLDVYEQGEWVEWCDDDGNHIDELTMDELNLMELQSCFTQMGYTLYEPRKSAA